MPLPSSHTQRLFKDLRIHEERLKHLRGQVLRLSEEAKAHEMIINLGRDHRLIDTLGHLYDDSSLIRELADDPDGFLRGRGIALPAGGQVEVITQGERTVLSVHLVQGPWDYSCVWDPANGFSLVQHSPSFNSQT